jgi:2-desacetyl-2-hydroxyethyl bacteriochlorophyllide A dehydrogenase
MPKQTFVEFTAKCQVRASERELPDPGEGQVLVRSEVSLMSTGTENIVFNQLYDPGTHWDRWVKFPFQPGYAVVGTVEAVGKDVTSVKEGDRVALRKSHASRHLVREGECIPVLDGVSTDDAAWFALAKITYNGARNANFSLGQKVLVIGAGPIGQMTLRWAIAAGAEETLVVDPLTFRLGLAREGGANHTFDGSVTDALPEVERYFEGLADTVADTTGHAEVFRHAQTLAKNLGTLLLIGDTGSPVSQCLASDTITRGLRIVGAHDNNVYPLWTVQDTFRLFFRFVRNGRINLKGMNTHRFSGENPEPAYQAANERRGETMGILFHW